MGNQDSFLDICREQSQGIKKAWKELKEAGKDVKSAFAELGDVFKKNSDKPNKTEKNITKEDILSEIKATNEVIAQAQKAVSEREEAQDSFASNLRKLLEQAKNNPDMLCNIPDENIHEFEASLEGLTRLNDSGLIQQECITDLKEFLALYYESQKREKMTWRLRDFKKNCDTVIERIKKAYGNEAASTFGYCEKLVAHDDEIIRKTRFIILVAKLYPTNFGYYCRDEIERLLKELKKSYDIENDSLVSSQIQVLEEFISLEHNLFTYSGDPKKRRAEQTAPENILHEGNYVAKLTEGKASIIDYMGTNDDIIIPDTIKGIPVDAINNNAFYNKIIRQASIPSRVKRIGKDAFSHNSLKQIILPDGLLSIGDGAFYDNKLTELNIPPSVTFVGKYSFQSNELVSVTIPAGVARIPTCTFHNNKLVAVELGKGIAAIEDNAFSDNCLETIRIPDSVTSIGSSVFMSNPLKEIILPANVEIDENGCTEGDLTLAYIRNNKCAGVYKCQGDNWKLLLDKENFTEWDISAHEKMEELAIEQEKAIKEIEKMIEKMKMSKKGRKLSKLQGYFSCPIPKEIWDVMPDKFRDYIRKEILSGESYVHYTPILPEKMIEEHPLIRMMNETITVSYGPLASRTYNARTGICVAMS